MRTDPTPIVATVKVEVIDGIKKLASDVAAQWKKQRTAQDAADLHGLEMGRLICEFAGRADVQVQISLVNSKENKPTGGRPKAAHCYIADLLCSPDSETGLSVRHLERCARAWMKAQKKGLPLNTSLRIAEASDLVKKVSDKSVDESQPSPERLFNTEATENENAEEREFDPDRDALVLAKKIQSFFVTPEGHQRLRSRPQRDKFAKKLNEAFEEFKIEWEILPKGRE